jgi:hypothetical protein
VQPFLPQVVLKNNAQMNANVLNETALRIAQAINSFYVELRAVFLPRLRKTGHTITGCGYCLIINSTTPTP